MITIDSSVPVPDVISNKVTDSIAGSIRRLDNGESFALPVARRKSLHFALWNERKRPSNLHKKFISRTLEENNERVVRCWRVQ